MTYTLRINQKNLRHANHFVDPSLERDSRLGLWSAVSSATHTTNKKTKNSGADGNRTHVQREYSTPVFKRSHIWCFERVVKIDKNHSLNPSCNSSSAKRREKAWMFLQYDTEVALAGVERSMAKAIKPGRKQKREQTLARVRSWLW